MPYKVLVTGSSGRLGQVTVDRLSSEGHLVTGVDRRPHPDGRAGMHLADLRHESTYRALPGGIQAVVHCAAVPWDGDPGELARSDLKATACLVRFARAAGCGRFIYASSIQVIASEHPGVEGPPQVAYLPLDGDSPPRPTNPYGWSKFASEILVRETLGPAGLQCVLLRFPWLTTPDGIGPAYRPLLPLNEAEATVVVEQGFSYLTFGDAARLIAACLRQDLPGVRTYLPAVCSVAPAAIPAYLRRYYAGVPLRVAEGRLSSLVSTERITAETGWQPATVEQLLPLPSQPGTGLVLRLLRRIGS